VKRPRLGLRRRFWRFAERRLSRRTVDALRFDLLRLGTRLRRRRAKDLEPPATQLHLGCGRRLVAGFLNVDVRGSDFDVDLGAGRLPWRTASFEAVVSEEMIEHLEPERQLRPLLAELHRVLRPGGELWLSCPDMEKICRAYVEGRLPDVLAERLARHPDQSWGEAPLAQLVNEVFHQSGEHENLYDLELLRWMLEREGFDDVERVDGARLLERFPGFPPRPDELLSLRVKAIRP
jgi:predicted SAM-dependent methyltransferase